MVPKSSDRIKELRVQYGLSQQSLAKRLHVTRSCVNAWEMGTSVPSVDNLIELHSCFHVSVDYLLGVESEAQANLTSLSEQERSVVYRLLDCFASARRAK